MAHEAQTHASPKPARYRWFRWSRFLVLFVYAITMVAIVLLIIAFFLKLFGASPDAPFTQWVYKSSGRVLAPFRGIFPVVEGESGSVLDFSILFAILMYGIAALAIHSLIEWLDRKLMAMREEARLESTPGYGVWGPSLSTPVPQAPPPRPQAPPGYPPG
jgi:uncharacterized protein YggT (Ycf19 family)